MTNKCPSNPFRTISSNSSNETDILPCSRASGNLEIVIVVKYVQIFDNVSVGKRVSGRKCDVQVKHGQCIPESTIGLLSDQFEGFAFGRDALFSSYMRQMIGYSPRLDTIKIKNLATRQDRGQYLVLFGCGQDENGVSGWFFQGFEKGIESRRRQHVHLVNDIDFVFTGLRRVANLIDQVSNVVHRIVGGGIQLMNIKGGIVLKTHAGITFPTRLHVITQILAVDGFGQNPGAGCFSYSPGTAEWPERCSSSTSRIPACSAPREDQARPNCTKSPMFKLTTVRDSLAASVSRSLSDIPTSSLRSTTA